MERNTIMTKGLLQVTGTIDITQFWPENESDGDTVHVLVDPDGFRFSPDGKPGTFKATHVFDDARVHGAETKTAVSHGKITIRLEHIDAPELHYSVPLKGTKNFRQYFGETAATKLHDLIAGSGQHVVHCEVRTAIDHPNEAFDTYGRLIGNIIIHLHNRPVNANHWLVENGWAFPVFYNSASAEEIKEVSQFAQQARHAGKGIWKHFSEDVGHPDFSLLFRRHGSPDPTADMGPVVIPKLFRREVLWHVSKEDGLFAGTFHNFLAKQKDGWVKTADFLRNPNAKPSAKTQNLSTLLNNKEIFELGPSDLVFFEKESALFDAKGKKVVSWGLAFDKAKLAKGAA